MVEQISGITPRTEVPTSPREVSKEAIAVDSVSHSPFLLIHER